MVCITTPTFYICINGERMGFLKGGMGWDRFLFTMIMEVFNIVLKQKIHENERYKYHAGCKEMKLTHLCFADDLLMLCNGDSNSVKVIREALDDFSKCLSIPNLKKSTMFCSNIKMPIKMDFARILPFRERSLPVRYLRVPLVTRKLNVKDCKCMVDKLKRRIRDWKNRFLSYAGYFNWWHLFYPLCSCTGLLSFYF